VQTDERVFRQAENTPSGCARGIYSAFPEEYGARNAFISAKWIKNGPDGAMFCRRVNLLFDNDRIPL
jgi:hypothetical protein